MTPSEAKIKQLWDLIADYGACENNLGYAQAVANKSRTARDERDRRQDTVQERKRRLREFIQGLTN